MKKMLEVLTVIAVFSLISFSNVHADEGKEKADGPMHEMMGDKGRMKGMMHGMKPYGGHSMVATSDGGVVVLSDNQLTKYDKNLNVVKEVKIDDGKKEMCSECAKKMKMGKDKNTDDAPASAAEHKDHH